MDNSSQIVFINASSKIRFNQEEQNEFRASFTEPFLESVRDALERLKQNYIYIYFVDAIPEKDDDDLYGRFILHDEKDHQAIIKVSPDRIREDFEGTEFQTVVAKVINHELAHLIMAPTLDYLPCERASNGGGCTAFNETDHDNIYKKTFRFVEEGLANAIAFRQAYEEEHKPSLKRLMDNQEDPYTAYVCWSNYELTELLYVAASWQEFKYNNFKEKFGPIYRICEIVQDLAWLLGKEDKLSYLFNEFMDNLLNKKVLSAPLGRSLFQDLHDDIIKQRSKIEFPIDYKKNIRNFKGDVADICFFPAENHFKFCMEALLLKATKILHEDQNVQRILNECAGSNQMNILAGIKQLKELKENNKFVKFSE